MERVKNIDRFKPEESGKAFLKLNYYWVKHLGLTRAAILAEYVSAGDRLKTKHPYKAKAELARNLHLSDRTIQREIRNLVELQILIPAGCSLHGVPRYAINLLKIGA